MSLNIHYPYAVMQSTVYAVISAMKMQMFKIQKSEFSLFSAENIQVI